VPEDKPKEKDPKDEIRETLEGILAAVQKKKDAAKASGKASKPWGWVVGLVMAVLVFLALAFAAWSAWKKGREIAKLKHKIDVDEEKKKQARVDEQIATNEERRRVLAAEATILESEIADSKNKIKQLEKERIAANAKIDAVTSWEDVDHLLGE
jgi:Na+-transporting methylmalonyl-CoA/oxaloacetate decarboxylase gamma subunit